MAGTLAVKYDSVGIELTAHRPMEEARLEEIVYTIILGTNADQAKLDLMHKNLMKFGTIYNTVKSGTRLTGEIRAK